MKRQAIGIGRSTEGTRTTPAEKVDAWLPNVHTAVANLSFHIDS